MKADANPAPLQEPSLTDYTESVAANKAIRWYRTKLPAGEIKALHEKSDWKGGVQSFGYLAIIVVAFAATLYSFHHWSWWITCVWVFVYGTVSSFMINAVHELGHGTVFKTKCLNTFFCRLFAFIGWINPELFQSSHTLHHRYTLHPPDDLEVVLPVHLIIRKLVRKGLFDPAHFFQDSLKHTYETAMGRYGGDWLLTRYPESDLERRVAPTQWARFLLAGHLAIVIGSILTGQWIVPILTCSHHCIGGLLFFLCNDTQHIGLCDNVDDFRLCCRSFTVNPIVQFLYWHMNYHIEHHMYAAVPCYNLHRLHRLIQHDLPPTPHGLVNTWREIAAILEEQKRNPSYQHCPVVPQAGDTVNL